MCGTEMVTSTAGSDKPFALHQSRTKALAHALPVSKNSQQL